MSTGCGVPKPLENIGVWSSSVYSLLHLTCLPAGPDRTKGLHPEPLGTPVGNRGVRSFSKLLVFVHDQLSQCFIY